MPSFNPLVKEFLNAADDKRKEVLSKIEEDVAKLSGSAPYTMFASYSIDLTFSKLHCQMSTGLPFEPKHCTRHIKFLVGVRYLTFILVSLLSLKLVF